MSSSVSVGPVVILISVPAALVLASCSPGGGGSEQGTVAFGSESAGISLNVPAGWHATSRRFTGLVDPLERVALTSYRVHDTGRSRRCSPDPALRQLPRSGVAAFLLEYMDAAARRSVDPRPPRFQLQPAVIGGFGGFDCFLPPPGTDAYAFNFGDSGRAFQLLVAVGADATAETRRAAVDALNSIQIQPCDRPLPSDSKPRCRRPLPV